MNKPRLFLVAAALAACASPPEPRTDLERWEQHARNVAITRDDWGIPHVKGRTDADAVFGMIYAQAEDDFHRVEVNYLNAMGRLAEAEGEREIWRDLRMKLFIDPEQLQAQYAASPEWLQTLMNAWADGLNYYLATHPETKPMVLQRFLPWMALSFSEGSIGGDIEDVSLRELEAFYGGVRVAANDDDQEVEAEPGGSNGFAIAPSNTAGKHALLLINPHTSFFFREELQMTSDEGLNAYGAVTWGQFFVYQGFNERAGWMHTSSGADVVDEYAETIVRTGQYFYKYGTEERPVTVQQIAVPYKTASGSATREFRVYRTHHGPVVREADGKWISVKLMNSPVKALTQSWSRTKAKNYAEFRATMELHTNSSNNTIFADGEGNIAYLHANHVARRDPKFDWQKPVDGSDPRTEWGPLHGVEESPLLLNPASGWLYNTNNWPYSAAGPDSPAKRDYPSYMETFAENARGLHAIAVLSGKEDFTLGSLRDAAYDSWLPPFARLVPLVVAAWDGLPAHDPLKRKLALAEQVATLRAWDHRWSAESVATSLAVFWGERLWKQVRGDPGSDDLPIHDAIASKTTPAQMLQELELASLMLAVDFGRWQTPWGEINRFQRLTNDIVHPFSDDGPSIPVPFTSGVWGSLASFGARPHKGSRRIYGTSGNSFVAVVEFGDRVRALAVTAGGLNGVPGSKHFNDQAERYAKGDLREVYFYPDQLAGHTERVYRPGEKP